MPKAEGRYCSRRHRDRRSAVHLESSRDEAQVDRRLEDRRLEDRQEGGNEDLRGRA